MASSDFWAKFRTLYDDIENECLILKNGIVLNKFDDGEAYTSFIKRSFRQLLLLGKEGNYQAQVIFNNFILDRMHIMYRIKEISDKLRMASMNDGSQFTDGMFMKAYTFKHIEDICEARYGKGNVLNIDAEFVYEMFINNYASFNWEDKEEVYGNRINARQKMYND